MPTIEVATACNNEMVLRRDLLSSPMIASGEVSLQIQRGFSSAALAYNAALDTSRADVVIFAHQDVYFPGPWLKTLQEFLDSESACGDNWGVLGVWSITTGGEFVGRVWCSASNREFVGLSGVREVASMDEIVIVVNRRSGLRFDDRLPGFHLYGTDISCTARSKGFKVHGITAPVVHNSRFSPVPFDAAYFAAYNFVRRKWKHQLPLQTPCGPVLPRMMHLRRVWCRHFLLNCIGRLQGPPPKPSPSAWSLGLGYEQGVD